jgi:hypothetical protein
MTNIDTLTNAAKRSFSLSWMPHIRIAIPALARRSPVERTARSAEQLERDELMALFQSDLSGMKSLKSKKALQNVIQLRPYRVIPVSRQGRAA